MDSVFLQHKQSILVISSKKIYAYEDELVISSDSAPLSEHHGAGEYVYKLSTLHPGLLKLYITRNLILCLK